MPKHKQSATLGSVSDFTASPEPDILYLIHEKMEVIEARVSELEKTVAELKAKRVVNQQKEDRSKSKEKSAILDFLQTAAAAALEPHLIATLNASKGFSKTSLGKALRLLVKEGKLTRTTVLKEVDSVARKVAIYAIAQGDPDA